MGDLGRGLAAFTALAALVVGVPVALALAVGSPLPRQVPDLAAIGEALTTSGIDDTVVVNSVAVVIWLAWLQVALAFGLELVAIARRRPALALPGARRIQHAMAGLVTTAALIGTALATSRTAPAASVRLAAPVAISTVLPPAASVAIESAAPAVPDDPRATYVVQRHDSLWSIAEERLGDGLRWHEIRTLNVGRQMPDGAVIDASSDVIHPGWVLELPNEIGSGPATTSLTTVVVERGESLWTIAESTAPVDATPTELHDHWADIIDLNRGRLTDPSDPGLIFTGQEIVVPVAAPQPPATALPTPVLAVPLPAPVPPLPPASTNAPSIAPPSAEVIDDGDVAADVDAADEDGSGLATRLGVAGAALAASVLATVRLARRRRLMNVPRGYAPALEEEPHDELRVDLVVTADADSVERRDGALRDLARALHRHAPDVRPRLVRIAADRVEVLLSRPAAPGDGSWSAEGGGTVWTTSADLRDAPGHEQATTLVGIGAPEEGDQLYLDLEAMGVVAVSGSEAATIDLVRSFVTELTSSTDVRDVLSVDLDGVLPGADAVAWDDVADDLLLRAEQTRALLAANRWPTPFHARANGPDDALTPVVVVVGAIPDDERFDELCRRVTTSPSTVSLVVLGTHPLGVDVVVTDGWLRIPSIDLVCRAQRLDEETAAAIEDLLIEPDGQLVLLEDVDPTPRSFADIGEASHRRPGVLVRLLGEIDVVGGRRPLQPKQVAVMAYVALHSPVSTERVEDAIWPTLTGTRRKRLANTLSDIRRRLGSANLPMQSDGRYTLGSGVGTDVQEFERLDHLSAQAAPEVAIGLLREALELVRGPVFTYRSADRASYVWIDTENWLTTWELKVANAALRLSDLALDLDDTDTAVWAAEQGLLCIPTHSALTEALMRAYWRRGDREAAEGVYDSHVAALEELEIDDVAETTIDLRDQIKAGRSA